MSEQGKHTPKVRLPKLAPHLERAFLRCNECGAVYWYDFQPFSISMPVVTKPCGHGISQSLYTTSTSITEKQYRAAIAKAEGRS